MEGTRRLILQKLRFCAAQCIRRMKLIYLYLVMPRAHCRQGILSLVAILGCIGAVNCRRRMTVQNYLYLRSHPSARWPRRAEDHRVWGDHGETNITECKVTTARRISPSARWLRRGDVGLPYHLGAKNGVSSCSNLGGGRHLWLQHGVCGCGVRVDGKKRRKE
jgi:hypothetical protein